MLKRHILGFILVSLTGCFKHNKLVPKSEWGELECMASKVFNG